ncbi:MAG: FtsK/SpoIIIE domain-containing protein [Nostocoides sp.]
MPLRLTVLDPSGHRHDLVVEGGLGCPLSQVLRAGGLASLSSVRCNGQPLPLTAPFGMPPLVDGAVLSLGTTPPVATDPAGTAAAGGVTRAVVRLVVVAGPDAGHGIGLTPGTHRVGRDGSCHLVIADQAMSRRHARVLVTGSGIDLIDDSSTNGVLGPDGTEQLTARLQPGQQVLLGRSRLQVRVGRGAPAPIEAPGDGTIGVHRGAVDHRPPPPVPVTLPTPPLPEQTARTAWIPILIPLPIAAVMALMWGPQLLAFALMGPLIGWSTTWTERRAARARQATAQARYEERRDEAQAAIDTAIDTEREALDTIAPDPMTVLECARDIDRRLWSREPGAPHWLTVRIGTGTVPAHVDVVGSSHIETPTIAAAPVLLELGDCGALAIVANVDPGREDRQGRRVGDAIVGQLAVWCPPGALSIWVVGAAPASERAWWDLLPHRAGRDLTDAQVLARLAERAAQRTAGGPVTGQHPVASSTDLLVIGPQPITEGTNHTPRAMADLIELAGNDSSLMVIALAGRSGPPTGCRAAIAIDETGGATITRRRRVSRSEESTETITEIGDLVLDQVGPAWTERLSRALAPLRPTDRPDGTVPPDRCRLIDLLQVDPADPQSLVDAWRSHAGIARIPIGVNAEGPQVIDLDTDGPHVLVGGTTGSGKSELLQTLVAALAITCSPEELSLVLVDYKGGAAFSGCRDLPHTVGLVTDLDADLANRALVSLGAELSRRERLLATFNATSWADYHAASHQDQMPLPRLVIVIDEFRLLIDELPAFVSGLIRLAAVGRSLGLHLIVATQRPGGAISPEIAANVNLRIALRVRDAMDSEQIIGTAHAAHLPPDLPGRAYASTQPTSQVLFQTAQVTGAKALAAPPLSVTVDSPAPRRTRGGDDQPREQVRSGAGTTDLDIIVGVTAQAAKLAQARPQPSPWLAPLPVSISVDHTLEQDVPDGVPLGLVDTPEQQSQGWFTWPPRETGGLAIIGGPGTGRTTASRTLLAGLGQAVIPTVGYAIDGGTGLHTCARLPWVGGVVPVGDLERLDRLLTRLRTEIAARQVELTDRGLPSVARWRDQDPLSAPARMVLLIDGWESFADSADPGQVDRTGDILTLLRQAATVDLHLVVTGGPALLTGRAARLSRTAIVLGRLDPMPAALAGLPSSTAAWSGTTATDGSTPALPEGRGRLIGTAATIQIAHLGQSPDASSQLAALADLAESAGPAGSINVPFTVPVLPTQLPLSTLRGVPAHPSAPSACAVDEDLHPCGFSPRSQRRLILGSPGSGRTTALTTLAVTAAGHGERAVLITTADVSYVLGTPLPEHLIVAPESDVGGGIAQLADTRETRRVHVLLDDADRLVGTPLEERILGLIRDDPDRFVVSAVAETGQLARLFRGLVVDVAAHRCGLLLGTHGPAESDVFGITNRRATGGVPGRGWLIDSGVATWVQVATPQ